MKRRRARKLGLVVAVAVLVAGAAAVAVIVGCESRPAERPFHRTRTVELLTTGYCNCGTCCSWERTWFGFGQPVYSAGRLKGKPKKVGVTASGTKARRGTIAADTRMFPFGTRLRVPGYGVGTVEDVGGAVKNAHIDLWFPTHREAQRWGVRRLKVEVEDRGMRARAESSKVAGTH